MRPVCFPSSRRFFGLDRASRQKLMCSILRAFKDLRLLVIVLLSLVLNGFWLWWGLPNGETIWAVDGIAPIEPLAAAKKMIVDDWWNSGYFNKYPTGHFFLLVAIYAPYVIYLWFTGGLRNPATEYPYGLENPEVALMVLTLLANATSALMGVGVAALVYLIARDFFGPRGAFFSGLIISCSPIFIYYSHTSNVDLPSIFWSALALYAFAQLVQGRMRRRNFILIGFAVGMAVATKEQVFGLFALLPFAIWFLQIEHDRRAQPKTYRISAANVIHALFAPNILWGFATSVLVFALATNFIFNWEANLDRYGWLIYKEQPEMAQKYMFPPTGGNRIFTNLRQAFWLVLDSMNPVLALISIAGTLVFVSKERWAAFFALPLVSYVVFISAMLVGLRIRFIMAVVLVLSLFGGRLLGFAWDWCSKRNSAFVAAFVALGIYSLLYGFNTNYLMMYDARYEAEAWIRSYIPNNARVEVYGPIKYLPRLPKNLDVKRSPFDEQTLLTLPERSPDYLIFSSARYNRFKSGSQKLELFKRLLKGDFGYQVHVKFYTLPLVGPSLIPALSPEILLFRKNTLAAVYTSKSLRTTGLP